jgi:hypothetical protein
MDPEGFIDVGPSDRRRFHQRNVLTKPNTLKDLQRMLPLRAFPEVHSWLNILFKRVDNTS